MPDDNDLFATNLAGMPILAIHGYGLLPHQCCFRFYLHFVEARIRMSPFGIVENSWPY